MTARRMHLIGIGGAGMSAIAKVTLERGGSVSGSDLKASRVTAALEAMGARITIGHDPAVVHDSDLVVVSSAIPPDDPELAAARAAGVPVVARGEALASLMAETRAVVVAGTHGKTTTTSMIVSVLVAAGWDPTYLIGGGLNDAGTNARAGTGDVAVCESDESDGSFLLLRPHVAVVTNVELDHVDHWDSLASLRDAFARFLGRVDRSGTVVLPAGRVGVDPPASRRLIWFGAGGDVAATSVEPTERGCRFSLTAGDRASLVELAVPGAHNVDNALAAAGACLALGLSVDEVAVGLAAYRGVERRFQVKGVASGVTIVDDYAHHPTEISATLAAARTRPFRRVVAVFQPHRFSRTLAFAREFGPAFADADRIVVTDVYGAGEAPVPGVTGKLIVDSVSAALPGRPTAYLPRRADLAPYLGRICVAGDVLLTLGAGDITSLGDELLESWG